MKTSEKLQALAARQAGSALLCVCLGVVVWPLLPVGAACGAVAALAAVGARAAKAVGR